MIITAKKTNQSYPDWFKSIAEDLMNNWSLKVNDNEFRFTEIEFYYKVDDAHLDPYVHANEKQLTNSQWYFHGSGLDITFGDESVMAYGGILIRGIQNVKTQEYIDGSLKLLTELFKQYGTVLNHSRDFGLIEAEHSKEIPIACPRVGLNYIVDENYCNRPYRFIINIKPEHHFKEKTKVAIYMNAIGKIDKDEINKMFGYAIIK